MHVLNALLVWRCHLEDMVVHRLRARIVACEYLQHRCTFDVLDFTLRDDHSAVYPQRTRPHTTHRKSSASGPCGTVPVPKSLRMLDEPDDSPRYHSIRGADISVFAAEIWMLLDQKEATTSAAGTVEMRM